MQQTTFSPLAHFWASVNPAVVMVTLLEPSFSDEILLMTGVPFPLWAGYLIFYSLVTVGALLLAVKKLRVNMSKYK